jgi:hypothetical protein
MPITSIAPNTDNSFNFMLNAIKIIKVKFEFE